MGLRFQTMALHPRIRGDSFFLRTVILMRITAGIPRWKDAYKDSRLLEEHQEKQPENGF